MLYNQEHLLGHIVYYSRCFLSTAYFYRNKWWWWWWQI